MDHQEDDENLAIRESTFTPRSSNNETASHPTWIKNPLMSPTASNTSRSRQVSNDALFLPPRFDELRPVTAPLPLHSSPGMFPSAGATTSKKKGRSPSGWAPRYLGSPLTMPSHFGKRPHTVQGMARAHHTQSPSAATEDHRGRVALRFDSADPVAGSKIFQVMSKSAGAGSVGSSSSVSGQDHANPVKVLSGMETAVADKLRIACQEKDSIIEHLQWEIRALKKKGNDEVMHFKVLLEKANNTIRSLKEALEAAEKATFDHLERQETDNEEARMTHASNAAEATIEFEKLKEKDPALGALFSPQSGYERWRLRMSGNLIGDESPLKFMMFQTDNVPPPSLVIQKKSSEMQPFVKGGKQAGIVAANVAELENEKKNETSELAEANEIVARMQQRRGGLSLKVKQKEEEVDAQSVLQRIVHHLSNAGKKKRLIGVEPENVNARRSEIIKCILNHTPELKELTPAKAFFAMTRTQQLEWFTALDTQVRTLEDLMLSLDTLFSIANSHHDLNLLFQTIMYGFKKILRGEDAQLFVVLDDAPNKMAVISSVLSALNPSSSFNSPDYISAQTAAQFARLVDRVGIAGEASKTNEIMRIEDPVTAHPSFNHSADSLPGGIIRSLIAIPLFHNSRRWFRGSKYVLCVYNKLSDNAQFLKEGPFANKNSAAGSWGRVKKVMQNRTGHKPDASYVKNFSVVDETLAKVFQDGVRNVLSNCSANKFARELLVQATSTNSLAEFGMNFDHRIALVNKCLSDLQSFLEAEETSFHLLDPKDNTFCDPIKNSMKNLAIIRRLTQKNFVSVPSANRTPLQRNNQEWKRWGSDGDVGWRGQDRALFAEAIEIDGETEGRSRYIIPQGYIPNLHGRTTLAAAVSSADGCIIGAIFVRVSDYDSNKTTGGNSTAFSVQDTQCIEAAASVVSTIFQNSKNTESNEIRLEALSADIHSHIEKSIENLIDTLPLLIVPQSSKEIAKKKLLRRPSAPSLLDADEANVRDIPLHKHLSVIAHAAELLFHSENGDADAFSAEKLKNFAKMKTLEEGKPVAESPQKNLSFVRGASAKNLTEKKIEEEVVSWIPESWRWVESLGGIFADLEHRAAQTLSCSSVFICVLDTMTNKLWRFSACLSKPSPGVNFSEHISFNALSGLHGSAISSGATVVEEEPYKNVMFDPREDFLAGTTTRNIMVSLIHDHRENRLETFSEKVKNHKRQNEKIETSSGGAAGNIDASDTDGANARRRVAKSDTVQTRTNRIAPSIIGVILARNKWTTQQLTSRLSERAPAQFSETDEILTQVIAQGAVGVVGVAMQTLSSHTYIDESMSYPFRVSI